MYYLLVSSLDKVVKEAGDGEGADAADNWGDGGEVGASIERLRKITFYNAIFAGGTSIYKNSTGTDKIIRN